MDIDKIFEWILSHPKNYPGLHLTAQPRTNQAYKPLEPKAQVYFNDYLFHIIFKITSEYIKERLNEGKGVNMRKLGAFCFEVISEKIKPAQQSNFDVSKDLEKQRQERKHIHLIRPCFIPDKEFRNSLQRYLGKEEISASKSQHSIYQQGFAMMFCNPDPISVACFLGKNVVQSAHDAFIKAVIDLTTLSIILIIYSFEHKQDYNFNIDFGFVNIKVNEQNLQFKYDDQFRENLNLNQFENKMRKSDMSCSDHWSEEQNSKWAASSMFSILSRPLVDKEKTNFEKTIALKIMSLDLNTTEKTDFSKVKSAEQKNSN